MAPNSRPIEILAPATSRIVLPLDDVFRTLVVSDGLSWPPSYCPGVDREKLVPIRRVAILKTLAHANARIGDEPVYAAFAEILRADD
jgi:hypothetical protein